jgi:hypothetical protein
LPHDRNRQPQKETIVTDTIDVVRLPGPDELATATTDELDAVVDAAIDLREAETRLCDALAALGVHDIDQSIIVHELVSSSLWCDVDFLDLVAETLMRRPDRFRSRYACFQAEVRRFRAERNADAAD